jgi:RNA polymerase sigma factor (TIGR02999 family)
MGTDAGTPQRTLNDQVTRLLDQAAKGNPEAAGTLLPLVYDELRRLASRRMAEEPAGHTLQATALVHEAFLRLVDVHEPQRWDGRAHFFAAAAEAMRRILVESARHKATLKRGGDRGRVNLDQLAADDNGPPDELLALDEALTELERHDAQAAKLVKLRYFAGLTHQESAEALGIGRRAADRVWALARAWLYQHVRE